MQVLRLMALPLFALSLSVSITGCDQKNDTLQVDWPHESPDNQYHLNK